MLDYSSRGSSLVLYSCQIANLFCPGDEWQPSSCWGDACKLKMAPWPFQIKARREWSHRWTSYFCTLKQRGIWSSYSESMRIEKAYRTLPLIFPTAVLLLIFFVQYVLYRRYYQISSSSPPSLLLVSRSDQGLILNSRSNFLTYHTNSGGEW